MSELNSVHNRRVVVTGLGPISSIGIGVDEFYTGLRHGKNGATKITSFDTDGFDHNIGCEIKDFDPIKILKHTKNDNCGRSARFSASAARIALTDSGINFDDIRTVKTIVAVGTTDGESRDIDSLAELSLQSCSESLDRRLAERIPASHLAVAIAKELKLINTEILTIPAACAAGNYAIGYGYDTIRTGEAEVAFCGGADSVCLKTFAGFYRLGTIAPEKCSPFDLNRKGILTGEGAGILILESYERAIARNARIYAEVLGYGLNCDADHPVAPNEESLARCIQSALKDARLLPKDVDLVSAHGTGTKANDECEVRAMKRVFGDKTLPVTVSTKSMIGHTMGAASALSAIACTLGISRGFIPPTINYSTPDPECPIDCVPNISRVQDLRIVQNNALAFGGTNAIVIFGKYYQ